MSEFNYLLSVRTNGGMFIDNGNNGLNHSTTAANLSQFSQEIHGDDFSLNESVILLQSLWRTEYHSPVILPYPTELIQEIQESLQSQQVSQTTANNLHINTLPNSCLTI